MPTEAATLKAIPEDVKVVARKLYSEYRYVKPRDCYGVSITGEVTFDQVNSATRERRDAEEAFWQVLALLDNNGFYCHP